MSLLFPDLSSFVVSFVTTIVMVSVSQSTRTLPVLGFALKAPDTVGLYRVLNYIPESGLR